MTTTQDLPNGQTMTSNVARPYAVRLRGVTRSFGSLAAARAAAEGGAQIFFDYAPGCGTLLEQR